ncbi:LapA family protein [Deinococcus aluminii]|uniref:LapA family protein n=1 Tax=Deinococcus aluminii TaxID=1656885 RepID=A0ABP9XDT5_9DEIO
MRTIVLIIIVVLAVLFAILNRHALMFGHTLNLGFATYQNVPLGLILLLTALVLALVFYFWAGVAGLRAQADSARLLRDMEALRVNLDSQESSRFAQLQSYIDQRFNALGSGAATAGHAELDTLNARIDALQRDMNVQLAQIDDYLKRRLG